MAGHPGAGSIPACAGEALHRRLAAVCRGVYPRVCRGSTGCPPRPGTSRGLSPRVRGKPIAASSGAIVARSIPACAGEATAGLPGIRPSAVYPRVCGGSAGLPEPEVQGWGLSPRVRGKPYGLSLKLFGERSIPACAGEADARGAGAGQIRVYPRVCGGSDRPPGSPAPTDGLSPRVRGKRLLAYAPGRGAGSIPACAGEARYRPYGSTFPEVYPRVCGGSGLRPAGFTPATGLSPRVRGKRDRPPAPRRLRRSIPACAGEATADNGDGTQGEVYPRVCGGSGGGLRSLTAYPGLSPRVRGKPFWDDSC